MPYLVDSDIMVDLTRESGAAADYLDGLAGVWSSSTITCLELLAGARTQRVNQRSRFCAERIPGDPAERGHHAPRILPHEDLRALTWIAGP